MPHAGLRGDGRAQSDLRTIGERTVAEVVGVQEPEHEEHSTLEGFRARSRFH